MCSFCKKPGHSITDCYPPDCQKSRWCDPKSNSRQYPKQRKPSLNVESVRHGSDKGPEFVNEPSDNTPNFEHSNDQEQSNT